MIDNVKSLTKQLPQSFHHTFFCQSSVICLSAVLFECPTLWGSRVVQWSKALHLSARSVITDTLVQIQAVSQPAVIGSPIGWPTIVPGLAGVGFHCNIYKHAGSLLSIYLL